MGKKQDLYEINKKRDWRMMIATNLLYSLVFSIMITLILFWTLFLSCKIMETSMQPTLNHLGGDKSDVVFMNRFKNSISDVKNGDIVIVQHNNEWLIKRVIASKGDTINFKKNKNGAYEVYVNGNILKEDYVKKYTNLSNYNGMKKYDSKDNEIHPIQRLYESGDEHFEEDIPDGFEYPNYKLKKDEMFIMGDNRYFSISDSRDNGAFGSEDLIGIVKYVKKYEQSTLNFYLNLLFNDKIEKFC